ncbi:MAG TPA: hypothetical protein VI589_06945 [Vicinamibacteria bacterium]
MDNPLDVEKALKATPIPKGIVLEKRKDDPTRPVLREDVDSFGWKRWLVTILPVDARGRVYSKPPAAKRPRPVRFCGYVPVGASAVANMRRIEERSRELLDEVRRFLAHRARSLKAARTARLRGTAKAGPGRPPGITRAMEKTGSNRARMCPYCRGGHRRGPCRE